MTTITKNRMKTMNMTRSIETEYQGIFFRSRLEARWARYFDLIGVEWQFEPQPFEIDLGYDPDFESHDTEMYLPDFYFPRLNRWVEVKGSFLFERIRFFSMLIEAVKKGGPCDGGIYLLSTMPRAKENFRAFHPFLISNSESIVTYKLATIENNIPFVKETLESEVSSPEHLKRLLSESFENLEYIESDNSDAAALSEAASIKFERIRM